VFCTAGFSGAQLANLVNEAALAAARGGASQVWPLLQTDFALPRQLDMQCRSGVHHNIIARVYCLPV
jgi:hypothetical protein